MTALLSCSARPTPDDEIVESWVARSALPVDLATEDSGVESDWLRSAIGPASVVGIGESRHDAREQLLLKGALVRTLVEKLRFRTLIIEESFPHAEALDAFVTTGEGDPEEVLGSLAGWYLWDNEEFLSLVRWLRRFNQDREPARRVRVFGMDITAPAPAVREVLEALRRRGSSTGLDETALGLELQRGDEWPRTIERYAALTGQRRRELAEAYERLVERIDEETDGSARSGVPPAGERLRMLARLGRWGNRLFSAEARAAAGEVREEGMARTVRWIVDRRSAAGGAIVWAHNLHVAKEPFVMPALADGDLRPMGVRLARHYGGGYLAIGACFGRGSYSANLPPGERRFETPDHETMDGVLARAGIPTFLLDLRTAVETPPAERWLAEPRTWRAQDAAATLVPARAFDLVYFIGEISRSRPTAGALRRYRSAGSH